MFFVLAPDVYRFIKFRIVQRKLSSKRRLFFQDEENVDLPFLIEVISCQKDGENGTRFDL